MKARQFQRQPILLGQRLRLGQRDEAFFEAIVDAHARGHADQRARTVYRRGGRVDRRPVRVDAFRHMAELEQQRRACQQQRTARVAVGI